MFNIKKLINDNGYERMLCPKYSPNHNPKEHLIMTIKI